MNPGKWRDEITLQSSTGATNAAGEYVEAWTDFATLMTWVKTPSVTSFRKSSREIVQQDRTIRRNEFMIQMRYDDDVNTAMRVLWLDHIFEIEGITADVHNNDYMWLHCYDTVRPGQGFGAAKGAPILGIEANAAAVANQEVVDMPDVSVTEGGTQSAAVTLVVTIKNTGTLDLTITTPMAFLGGTAPTGYSITDQPASPIAADGSDTFTVSFTVPDSAVETQPVGTAQDYSATIPIETNDFSVPSFLLGLKCTVSVVVA